MIKNISYNIGQAISEGNACAAAYNIIVLLHVVNDDVGFRCMSKLWGEFEISFAIGNFNGIAFHNEALRHEDNLNTGNVGSCDDLEVNVRV